MCNGAIESTRHRLDRRAVDLAHPSEEGEVTGRGPDTTIIRDSTRISRIASGRSIAAGSALLEPGRRVVPIARIDDPQPRFRNFRYLMLVTHKNGMAKG
jgi:hypothetical protein